MIAPIVLRSVLSTLSLHDALPISTGLLLILSDEHTRLARFLTAADKTYLAWVSFGGSSPTLDAEGPFTPAHKVPRSEEHTSELQSRGHLVCRLLLEKKNIKKMTRE